MTNLMDFPNELLDKIFYECTPLDVLALGKVNKRIREVVTSKYFSDDYWHDNARTCGCGNVTFDDRRGRIIKDMHAGYSPQDHFKNHYEYKDQIESNKKKPGAATWLAGNVSTLCLPAR